MKIYSKFRQKYEEKYASQKYVKDSLNRPAAALQAIDEEQQTDISIGDSLDVARNNSDLSQQNVTTYKRAYQNYNQRSFSSNDGMLSNKNNEENENEEQIDTIQLEDDRRQPLPAQSSNKLSRKPSSTTGRPPSSHKQKHRIETMQFSDDDNTGGIVQNLTITNGSDDEQKEIKPSSSLNENISDKKSRRIRRLQHKLSAQEEETKKKFDELQTKQSRLENALKLLVKQTATFKKRREGTSSPTDSKFHRILRIFILYFHLKILMHLLSM